MAKPDRTIKIPIISDRRLPRALSCSCLSVYRCHSAVMAAFISFHARHSVPGRQFAPSWTVCTNPPFSPTAAPYPVTIVLSPTRKDTTKRHWQQPLVTGLAERVNVDGAIEFLKWWPNYGYTGRTVFGICALLKPVTRLSSSPTDLTFEKPPPQVVFSFSEQEITRRKKGTQEDPFYAQPPHGP